MKVIKHEGDLVTLEVDRDEFDYLCRIMPSLEQLPHGFDAGRLNGAMEEYCELSIETYFGI